MYKGFPFFCCRLNLNTPIYNLFRYMKISVILNGSVTELPESVTNVARLLEWRHIPVAGTAVAINSQLIPAPRHVDTPLHNMDSIMIISAAYGG